MCPFTPSLRVLARINPIRQTRAVPDPVPQELPAPMYKVTLHRSLIGTPEKIRRHARTLGLNKRMETVYVPQNPATASLILKLKELVKLENVTAITPGRVGGKGYEVVSRARHGTP